MLGLSSPGFDLSQGEEVFSSNGKVKNKWRHTSLPPCMQSQRGEGNYTSSKIQRWGTHRRL